jgi:hypothetical protein
MLHQQSVASFGLEEQAQADQIEKANFLKYSNERNEKNARNWTGLVARCAPFT